MANTFVILQKLLATREIDKHPHIFPSFSLNIFSHLTRLDQSHAMKCI